MVGIGQRVGGRGPHCWFGRTVFSVYTLPHCYFEEGSVSPRRALQEYYLKSGCGGRKRRSGRVGAKMGIDLITGNVQYVEIQRSIIKAQNKDSQAPLLVR